MEIDRAATPICAPSTTTPSTPSSEPLRSTHTFDEVAFSFNGGKDSTVLLHLLRAGYYLHKISSGHGDQTDHTIQNCPMRVIYSEGPTAFPEIDSFTYDTAAAYGLPLETIRTDFKSGLEALLKESLLRQFSLALEMAIPMRLVKNNSLLGHLAGLLS